jgi:hypothetical protein
MISNSRPITGTFPSPWAPHPMKSSDNRSTPTTATFRGTPKEFSSEKDAYLWMLGRFISCEPQLFTGTASHLRYLCYGARGAIYFSRSRVELRKPQPLPNGWYVELNLGNTQKIRNLGKLASAAQLKYGTDWKWDALNRHTKAPIDVEALLAELEQFTRIA